MKTKVLTVLKVTININDNTINNEENSDILKNDQNDASLYTFQ